MKTRKTLTILFMVWLVPLLVVCASQAAPMGMAFTYQSRLIDANNPADGLYDFQFKLYDANVDGTQKGSTVIIDELDVIDGHFALELDFGSGVFDGNDCWLEIGVRQGDLKDPNIYTILSPRQQVTPTPYAIYAKTAERTLGGIRGSGTSNRIPKFADPNTLSNSVIYESGGNIGIGTTTPIGNLEVKSSAESKIYINSGKGSQAGIGFREDSSDKWLIGYSPDLQGGFRIYDFSSPEADRNRLYIQKATGNVGISTTNPSEKLQVEGTVKATAFVGDGSGLTGITLGAHDHFGQEWSGADHYGLKIVNNDMGEMFVETAIYGQATASSGHTYGGKFMADSDDGTGVFGFGKSNGVFGQTSSATGKAVYGHASSSSGVTYGVYGKTDSVNGYAGYFEGRGYFSSNVGIGTITPIGRLEVKSSGESKIYIHSGKSSQAGIGFIEDSNDKWLIGYSPDLLGGFRIYDFSSPIDDRNRLYVQKATGNVGIGTTSPGAKLHVKNGDIIQQSSGSTAANYFVSGDFAEWRSLAGPAAINYNVNQNVYLVAGSTGKVGIGTTNPQGKLDVNGSIYQRGALLHADYVFEPDYHLETIEEHSEFMWREKHLPDMPKIQKDENGQEIVEIGARSRGVVEELEKAHIYIDQLHKKINQLQEQNKKLEERISAIETIMNKSSAGQEGGAR
jgi:hypothetical protein